jgi:hypothetical protein
MNGNGSGNGGVDTGTGQKPGDLAAKEPAGAQPESSVPQFPMQNFQQVCCRYFRCVRGTS